MTGLPMCTDGVVNQTLTRLPPGSQAANWQSGRLPANLSGRLQLSPPAQLTFKESNALMQMNDTLPKIGMV
jgi:hypothetical protein